MSIISDEVAEAALEVFWANEDETYLTAMKRALESAAPHRAANEDAISEAQAEAWEACADLPSRPNKTDNPYRTAP